MFNGEIIPPRLKALLQSPDLRELEDHGECGLVREAASLGGNDQVLVERVG
jgi:hypothetical protein